MNEVAEYQINDHLKINYDLPNNKIYLNGELVLPIVEEFLIHITSKVDHNRKTLIFNLDNLNHIDSAGVTAVNHLKDILKTRGTEVNFEGGSESILTRFRIFTSKQEESDGKPEKISYFEKIGGRTYRFFLEDVKEFVFLMADIFFWSVVDLFHRKSRRKGEVTKQAVLIGVNAVPIVVGLSFIIGLVLALQSAAQLRNFGANIFIVDLTVIAMMREMGPLITAILVAGRSGSAIAAEIATMKVTSELDALTTMALNPIRFVVVPKMHGAVFTIPLLTILADVFGIIGGMVVAYFYLDIAPLVFYNRMGESLFIRDIITGFIKSFVFASLVVCTGSYFGFQVKEGAEGVGKVTTLAVVVAISLVIIADSILGLIFY